MHKTSLPRVEPHAAGVDAAAVLRFVQAVEEQELGLHSFMIMRHNKVAAEGWWAPYKPEYNHMLFSLSKSFTSTAIGFAVQEGLLSLDDFVTGFFEDKLPAPPCQNMGKMRLRHLLGMCTGHIQEPDITSTQDWVETFLTSYVPLEPGSKFMYNTAATYMCSAILQAVTGQRVSEYLRPRLLEPLGIENVWWETCPQGIDTGGFGFNIKTEDIAKFGLFLLNRGQVDGVQLLNSQWIDEATAWHIDNGPNTNPDWIQGYGYQFWRCQPEGVYRGDGAFGQYCVVMPEQDAVLAVQSGMDDMQPMLTLAWDILLPAMRDDVTPDEAAQKALADKLATLVLPMAAGKAPMTAKGHPADGVTYAMAPNQLGVEEITLSFAGEPCMAIRTGGETRRISIGQGAWAATDEGEDTQATKLEIFSVPLAACGAWNGQEYQVKLALTRRPFVFTMRFTFPEKGLLASVTVNVGGDWPGSVGPAGIALAGFEKA